MLPDLCNRVQDKQAAQKQHRDQHSKPQHFEISNVVYARVLPANDTQKTLGPMSFLIKLEDGSTVICHIDDLCSHSATPSDNNCTLTPDWSDFSSLQTNSPPSPNPPTQPELRRSSRISRPPDQYM